MFKRSLLATSTFAMLFVAGTAFAGAADDAKTHIQAIGSGDLQSLMRETSQIDPKLVVAAAY